MRETPQAPQAKTEERDSFGELKNFVRSEALDYMRLTNEERSEFMDNMTPRAKSEFTKLIAEGATREDIEKGVMNSLPQDSFAVVNPIARSRSEVQTPARVRMEFGIALVGILDNVYRDINAGKKEAKEKSPDHVVN